MRRLLGRSRVVAARIRAAAGLAIVAAGLVCLAGCGDGDQSAAYPDLRLEPDKFIFSQVRLNEVAEREVRLINPGRGELIIDDIVLIDGSTRSEFSLFRKSDTGALEEVPNDEEYRFTVAPDEQQVVDLIVRYEPVDDQPDSGTVKFKTNAQDFLQVDIPIQTESVGSQIRVSPQSLDFDRVTATESKTMETRVVNSGAVALTLRNIVVSGSQDFVPLVKDKDPRRQSEVLSDPDDDGVPGLAPGADFVIEVKYSPLTEGPDSGELSIFSDDVNRPEVKVNLIANGATPCLEVQPPALEFRTSLVNRTDSRPLNLASCGSQPLKITGILMHPDSDPAFGLDRDQLDEEIGSLPAILAAAVQGEQRPNRTIRVMFTPREQRIYNGKLLIETNDPVTPVREVNLLGRGVTNACPRASATQAEYYVLPRDVVVLDGEPSVDPDGPENRPEKFEWVVTTRPEHSISQPVEDFFNPAAPSPGQGIPDDPATPTALFLVDLPGTYTIELRVTDNLGLDSVACENPAVVEIIAQPSQDIHVQLVWTTPEDPDETDNQGTDLDLHLLHPAASNWFTIPYDCHYDNAEPDWGLDGDTDDNPSIDIDDVNGGGPENASLNNPENTNTLGAPYLVGVHYYRSSDRTSGYDYGSTLATVRVFLNGQLAWEYGGGFKELLAEDAFWDVAQIHWPAAQVDVRDRYYDQRP